MVKSTIERKRNKAIIALESAFGLKLSKQQRRIVNYNYKSPLLVNACAGSGKTTLLLFNIVLSIITGEYYPQNILAITFSKKAQLDMRHRYRHVIWNLKQHGFKDLDLHNSPIFVTFHALFYRILKHFPRYKHAKVLSSYTSISTLLAKAIHNPPKGLTYNALLHNIFSIRTKLINAGITWNGYLLAGDIHASSQQEIFHIIKKDNGITDPKFLFNYVSVIKFYCAYKKRFHKIDFNDMKTLLLLEISHSKGLQKVHQLMSGYQLCYIDEFQDIDSLQWIIMRKILSKSALSKLVVIGDDDQSIYSFRGSKPSIILNFTHKFKDSKRLNLSTNYRTSGYVLNAVKPLIMKNQYRMPKNLLPSKVLRSKGTIRSYRSMKGNVSSSEVLLGRIWSAIKNPKIKNSDIAILVRYNADAMLAIDWLADHGFYVKSKNFFQREDSHGQMNKVYKIYMNLMWALCCDSFSNLNNWSQTIGFNEYRKHIESVLKFANRRDYNHLSSYLEEAINFDERSGLIEQTVGRDDLAVAKAFRICHIHNRLTGRDRVISGALAFDQVNSLTKRYFSYMVQNHYMSRLVCGSTTDHLQHRLAHYPNILKYFHSELKKRHVLTNIMYDPTFTNSIHLMTIHKSKGLQFKHVFLFNLTNRDVQPFMIATDALFTPKISRKEFLTKLLTCTTEQMAHINGCKTVKDFKRAIYTGTLLKNSTYYSLEKTVMDRIKDIHKEVDHQYRTSNTKVKQKIISTKATSLKANLEHNALINDKYDQSLQEEFNSWYEQTVQNNKQLEEERRLIYVGCTRAEDSVDLNIGADSNPLLYELHIDKSDQMALNEDNQIIPLVKSKKKQYETDKKRLAKLVKKVKRESQEDQNK